MSLAVHTHYLALSGDLTAADVPLAVLALHSRGRPLPAAGWGNAREQLARMVGDGPTAELLRSGKPIAVESVRGGYVIRGEE